MDMLKKYFPFSFREKKDIVTLIIHVIIYLVVGFIAGSVIGWLSGIPVLNIIIYFVCGAIDLYVLVGAILSVLDFFKLLK